MPKDNLRDKLEGNELDLSLNNLDTVPVKELAAIPKATRLDLSCNQLVSLPDNFSSLTHLVKIDLSKNKLTELPDNFGNLQNLQHLDLLGNQLTLLPISFYKLTKLKWLDLKDNPLQPDLKKIAGDCLDENQCKKCAAQVLKYLRDYNSELERLKQKKLREEREAKQRQKDQEEAERERVRRERKQKKLENKKRKDESAAEGDMSSSPDKKHGEGKNGNIGSKTDRQKNTDSKSRISCLTILAILVLLVAVMTGVFYTTCKDSKNDVCEHYWKPMETRVMVFLGSVKSNTQELIEKFKETALKYYSKSFGNEKKTSEDTKLPNETAQT
ncbi:leucine-rich repeat-containing protein 59-like [Saccostrea echinata]|uniref:leucine-rich repeat-containing protein 59-like n=1 Tax=Saccostrea echinata TaxID=191078 RepID=UPI002A837CB3|nr:leucine-rich repeat-containing protein 59-like [Saccostrea echinata]